MASATAAEKIPVSIWTTEIDTDIVEEIALAKTGYNKESIRALVEEGKGDTVTLDDVNNYIAAERRIYAQLQTQANQAFVNDYAFLKTAAAAENAYVCSYAPMIVVSLTKSQIETLAKDSAVNTMYYSPKTEVQDEMDVSLPTIEADYTRDTGGYDGTGIKIGMVESGVPRNNMQLSYFNSLGQQRIFTHPSNTSSSQTEHATAVAEIMISDSSDYPGIVPNAELYSVGLSNVGFYQAVEWLLQNNVHVINMSAGLSTTGEYSASDKWVDHIAHNHSVHFVKAAGNLNEENNPNGFVTHPGLAYNAITVGAIDDNNTMYNLSDDVICNFSCYNEAVNTNGITPANKPDVMAPGVLIRTASFPTAYFTNGYAVTGTSFAAPHVTGVVAQLIDQYPSLAVLQDLMKAMLTAAVRHDYISYTPYQTSLFEKSGAGLVDAKACSEISYRGTFVSSTFTAAQSNYTKTYTFNATTSDEKIRVSLAWLKSVWFSGSDHLSNTTPGTDAPLANLDLIIVRPNGTELPMCQYENYDLNTNLVIIEFDPEVYGYGTYTVKVKIHDSTGKATYFGLAWWADRN